MRIIIFLLAVTSFTSLKAQTVLPLNSVNYLQQGTFSHYNLLNDSNALQKKWFVSMYTGIAAGMGFLNGGNTIFSTTQIGVQLNRRLNNNLFAFAAVSVTPAFFNFNHSINNTNLHQNYMAATGFNANGLGIYSGIQAGLMYVNDAKTFSISGSIGISNSNTPFYPANRLAAQKNPSFIPANQ